MIVGTVVEAHFVTSAVVAVAAVAGKAFLFVLMGSIAVAEAVEAVSSVVGGA